MQRTLFIYLAAAAVVFAAAAIAAAQEVATAVAEQEDQNDDPANVTATETIVIAHNEIPPEFFQRLSRSFQDIPQQQKGAV